MPVQEPEAVKVKFAYQSAKITKEVKKKELNIYKQKIIVKIKPGFQILNERFKPYGPTKCFANNKHLEQSKDSVGNLFSCCLIDQDIN
jgi:hypothetical protein